MSEYIGQKSCCTVCDLAKEILEAVRWIPVSERLPELENHGGVWESAVVLVLSATGTPDVASMDSRGSWDRFWGGQHIAKPTHWRPLPAPPAAAPDDEVRSVPHQTRYVRAKVAAAPEKEKDAITKQSD